jgi:hypothetical protein
MTAQEAIIEVYEAIGEPSDLPIYDAGGAFSIVAEGSIRILAALNRAQDYVSTYRVRGVKPKYFRCMEGAATFEPVTVSGTLGAQTSPYKTILLPAAFDASATGRFDGWTYDDGVEVRRVLRHVNVGGVSSIVLDKALPATPEARVVTLRQTKFRLGSGVDEVAVGRNVLDVIRLFDLETNGELERVEDSVSISTLVAGVGTPGSYIKQRQGFTFDIAADDARSFEVHFYAYPAEVVAAADEFALPEAFHTPIVLWASWWGFRRYMETTQAYATKRDFQDMMATLVDEVDAEDLFGGDSLRPIVK